MSAPVDVLAVMDADRYPLDTRKRAEMIAARAAMVELIAAGDFMASNPVGMLTPGAINRWNKARAAVASKEEG